MNRVWVSESGMGWGCHPKCCVFCDNCTDIWYDYNGPYMVRCDKGLSEEIGCKGECKEFIEENPVFITEEQYLKDLKERKKKAQNFAEEHKEELDKIAKAFVDSLLYGLPDIKDINL